MKMKFTSFMQTFGTAKLNDTTACLALYASSLGFYLHSTYTFQWKILSLVLIFKKYPQTADVH